MVVSIPLNSGHQFERTLRVQSCISQSVSIPLNSGHQFELRWRPRMQPTSRLNPFEFRASVRTFVVRRIEQIRNVSIPLNSGHQFERDQARNQKRPLHVSIPLNSGHQFEQTEGEMNTITTLVSIPLNSGHQFEPATCGRLEVGWWSQSL